MGFLGSDSSSSAQDNRQAGTDNASVVRGTGNLTVKDKAKAVGARGKLIESGAADLSGANAAVLAGSKITGVGGNLNVGDTTGAGVKAAADIASQGFAALTSSFQSSNDNALSVLDKSNALTSSVLSSNASLAANQQTGGASDQRKTFIWIIGGVIALFALLLFRRN